MSVQTNYTVYIRKELVGNLYGLTYTNSDRESAMAAGLVNWGQGVKRGTGERKCIQGGVVGGMLYGIAIRSINREENTRPGDGTISYKQGEEVAVLREGTIAVMAKSAVTRDGQVYVDDATGEFYGTAGAGRTLALNAKFERANSVGEVTLVNITRARQFEAA